MKKIFKVGMSSLLIILLLPVNQGMDKNNEFARNTEDILVIAGIPFAEREDLGIPKSSWKEVEEILPIGKCMETGCFKEGKQYTEINKSKILEWVESMRTDDGGYESWILDIPFAIFIYSDGFFEKIDTWEEVSTYVYIYYRGNFWGDMWGPVVAFSLYYNESPSWWDDYDKAVRDYKESWESDTHQASHVTFAYFQTGQIENAADFTHSIDLLLEQQDKDGSWKDIGETSFTPMSLYLYLKYFNGSLEYLERIKGAANRAEQYVFRCYHEDENYAWFSRTPESQNPDPELPLWATRCGTMALNTINLLKELGGNPTVYVERPRNYLYIFDREIVPLRIPIILGDITVIAEAFDEDGIEKVEFYVNNILKSTDYDEPYSWLWNEFAIGWHEINVVACDIERNLAQDKMNVIIFNLVGK